MSSHHIREHGRENGIPGKTGVNGKAEENEHDKFYTKPEIAAACLAELDLDAYQVIVEPSAGSGSFSKQIPNCVAYDLVPEDPSIIQADWFTVELDPTKKTLIVGNPPFDRQNSLARAFIKHATKQNVDTIAFILPKSFKKESVKNSIDKLYHLTLEKELPLNAFELEGEDYAVDCVFQIWERRNVPRELPAKFEAVGFRFVNKDENPSIAFRRVGGTAGAASTEWESKAEASHYFIQVEPGVSSEALVKAINDLPHSTRNDSVGPRSISRNELLKELYHQNTGFSREVKVAQAKGLW